MNINNIITKTIKEYVLKEEISKNDVVYHGTNNKFESFNNNKPIFFVDDINIAKTYGDIIIKASLNMNNPIELDFEGNSTYHFFDKWYMPSELAIKLKAISDDIKKGYSLDDDIKEYLENLGFSDLYGDLDGVIMKNISDGYDAFTSPQSPATNYVVFDKNQVNVVK